MSKEVLKFILFILATLTTAISGYQSGAPATGDEEESTKRRGRPAKAKPADDEDEEDEDEEDEEEDEISDAVLTAKAKKYIADGGTRAELKKLIVKYIKKGDEPLVPSVAENKRPAFLAELQKMTKAL